MAADLQRTIADVDADVDSVNREYPGHELSVPHPEGAWAGSQCPRCGALERLMEERIRLLFGRGKGQT